MTAGGTALAAAADLTRDNRTGYRSKASTLSISATPPANAKELFLLDDAGAVIDSVKPKDAAAVTFPDVRLPANGTFAFQINAGRGTPVAAFVVVVRTSPPLVESVSAPGFGTGGGTETISLRFNPENPLTKASAETASNFKVAHIENDKTAITPVPKFDAATNTVVLTVSGIVPGSYRLTIPVDASKTVTPKVAAIADVFGHNLEQVPGAAGEAAFETVLFTQQLPGALASENAPLTLQSGPNVEFPEYTRFRRVPDGFNPSDRVETRVVRLYYNRDAGRVAQIINRDTKAYNAATVDVRRRTADRARDDANTATDERMRQERQAVQLATEARAAEKELQAATAKANDTRTKADRSAATLAVRRDDLAAAQRDLARAKAAAGPLDTADAALAPLQARVTTLQNQYEAEKAQLEFTEQQLRAEERDTRRLVDEAQKRYRTAANALVVAENNRDLASPIQARKDAAQAAIDEARQKADFEQAAFSRLKTQLSEVQGTRAAERTRVTVLEQDLNRAKRALGRAETEQKATTVPDLLAEQQQRDVAALERRIAAAIKAGDDAAAAEPQLESAVAAARQKVAAARAEEARATASWQAKEQDELRAKENQFRREVAAARENPDIYAPGKPESDDPVRQCSVSVVGEGLIQIRGPIKGLNIIRVMINQLDAPVGQVRIGVHSVQVNGERGDRMEKVVANIQRYTDHARFLTAQSAQMLRKSVTMVASRKAEEAGAQCGPGASQANRDLKYLYSFYGKDFLDELADLDSEFLHTGNKLLSLNSMDSTSLSAALFQMALAKTSVRQEILAEFQTQVGRDLPRAELDYYMAGLTGHKCEACFDKKHYTLGCGPKFVSLTGYFNGEVHGEDTMTPIQREVVRLAQIFKTRMITEIQLNQRVMERSLLEERVTAGTYLRELQEARDKEKEAVDKLLVVQSSLFGTISRATMVFGQISNEIDKVERSVTEIEATFKTLDERNISHSVTNIRNDTLELAGGATRRLPVTIHPKDEDVPLVAEDLKWFLDALRRLSEYLWQFNYLSEENRADFEVTDAILKAIVRDNSYSKSQLAEIRTRLPKLLGLYRLQIVAAKASIRGILDDLNRGEARLADALARYSEFRDTLVSVLRDGRGLSSTAKSLFERQANPVFETLLNQHVAYQAARRLAEGSRRPLDQKKLLDLLVDDLEDKHIELLEGTRAHTANVDNYLKAIASALEDDFNTQYYYPAFRRVREASRSWDVTLGQIETTTILTNNRAFAKVDPAATFEFDLPKRNIAITEGFQAAKALMDEYGALTTDPTFLAAAKLYGGSPASALFGTGGGVSAVRNVLPGMSSAPDETILAQQGPGRKEFGSAFESLIPDPAIYKFETGTGYEIRPVLSPDGQNVVFNFNYMYTTNLREPVRADEKHLGRVKRHFVHTDVQLSNYELREVSKYQVALKASRTGRGVALLQDIPGLGVLFRPPPSQESSLQQNVIYAQSTIFPTLFDLMGLRYAPAVADLDPKSDRYEEWVARARRMEVEQRVYDIGSSRVDDALRVHHADRRADLWRSQKSTSYEHPNGYRGPGMKMRDSTLQEGYDPAKAFPTTPYVPGKAPIPFGGTVPGGYGLPGDFAPPPGGSYPYDGRTYDPYGAPLTPGQPNGSPNGTGPGQTAPAYKPSHHGHGSAAPLGLSGPAGFSPPAGGLPQGVTTVAPAAPPAGPRLVSPKSVMPTVPTIFDPAAGGPR